MGFSKSKVIVFDLDGTLYEDTHHFDYHAERLKIRLPQDKQPLFELDYQAVKNKSHPLRIGRIFDCNKDLILVQLDDRIQEAYKWSGEKLPRETVQELYPDPIELNLVTMLSIGDPWWIPISIAAHYGLSSRECYDGFLETRAYMMTPEFKMEIIEDFKETLEAVRQKRKLVLLTNSPEPDSEAILHKIGLHHVFDLKIFNGSKPIQTLKHFEHIKEFFGVSYEEIISIGDNWMNEIRPVRSLGCSTIFIDTHRLGDDTIADMVVHSIKEVIPFLKKIK